MSCFMEHDAATWLCGEYYEHRNFVASEPTTTNAFQQSPAPSPPRSARTVMHRGTIRQSVTLTCLVVTPWKVLGVSPPSPTARICA
jgi:hypothetical protein